MEGGRERGGGGCGVVAEAGGGDGGAVGALRGAADLHQARTQRRHGRARLRRLPLHVRRRLPLPHRRLPREVRSTCKCSVGSQLALAAFVLFLTLKVTARVFRQTDQTTRMHALLC